MNALFHALIRWYLLQPSTDLHEHFPQTSRLTVKFLDNFSRSRLRGSPLTYLRCGSVSTRPPSAIGVTCFEARHIYQVLPKAPR